MQTPNLPECHHPIVKALFRHTDQELLTLFQRYPERGQYFVAIFCRYSPILYTLIRHSARSPVQADYLFAITWRHIFYELRGLDVREFIASTQEKGDRAAWAEPNRSSSTPTFNLQTWLINITAVCINHAKLPPVESIHYVLTDAPPPLWCYLEQGLNRLTPLERLAVLMAQTFRWSESRILAHLRAEGKTLSQESLRTLLADGYRHLQEALPDDIQQIYGMDQVNPPEPDANAEGGGEAGDCAPPMLRDRPSTSMEGIPEAASVGNSTAMSQ